MNTDMELETWRGQWQSETAIPPALRRRVERQTRFMRIMLLADIFVTIAIGGATTLYAIKSPSPGTFWLDMGTWFMIAVAWAFSATVNRGNWGPSARTTAAFVDLSIRRCRARLAAVWFAAAFYLVQTAFVLGWVYLHSPARQMPLPEWLWFSSMPIDVIWGCTAAFFAFLAWYHYKKRAELFYLTNFAANNKEAFL